MKNIRFVTGVAIICCGVSVSWAATKPPSLRQPLKSDSFPVKKPISFSWDKVSGATKYRLIIVNDAKFTKYDVGKSKCAANSSKTCFSTTTQSAKFTLPATNPLLQNGGNFYWQIQAIGSSSSSTVFQGNNLNNKNSGEHDRWFSVSEMLAIPKIRTVASDPPSVSANESMTFSVELTAELPDSYAVNVDYGDGDKVMKGAGTDFSYTATMKKVSEDQDFKISILDPNGEEIDALGDTFTVTESGSEPVETPIVVKPEPVKPTPEPVKPVTVTVPSVSTISVSPQSVIQGNSLTFSTTLSASLPSGYSVKIDYGNGLFTMTGSGKNYSFSATPTVSAAYSIGVYDAKNTLKSNSQTGNFSVTAKNENPTLNLISGGISATIGTPYVTQLSASDSNLSLIFMDWGDGASESKPATSGANVSFSHSYSSANSFVWNATAYDSQDATSSTVYKTVTVSKPVAIVKPIVTKTTGYSKIANDGSLLSDDAKLGTNPTDWACTQDNKTGLIWEVKTTDGGLRDKDWRYSWYKPEGDNGGNAGYQNGNGHPEWCKGSDCDTYAFTNAVNAQTLCGANDWRMPTIDELKGLLTTTSTINQPLNAKLYIDAMYFPNTRSWFWSSSPNAGYSYVAWSVDFSDRYSDYYGKDYNGLVRLVR